MHDDTNPAQSERAPFWAHCLFMLTICSGPLIAGLMTFKFFVFMMGEKIHEPGHNAALVVFAIMLLVALPTSVALAEVLWILAFRNHLTIDQMWDLVHINSNSKIHRWLTRYDDKILEYIYFRAFRNSRRQVGE